MRRQSGGGDEDSTAPAVGVGYVFVCRLWRAVRGGDADLVGDPNFVEHFECRLHYRQVAVGSHQYGYECLCHDVISP